MYPFGRSLDGKAWVEAEPKEIGSRAYILKCIREMDNSSVQGLDSLYAPVSAETPVVPISPLMSPLRPLLVSPLRPVLVFPVSPLVQTKDLGKLCYVLCYYFFVVV